jgi:hypothetical protein
MVAPSRAEELAVSLPEEWRGAFVRFVETGEAEEPFLDFLETDKTAQQAVEVVYSETAAALERLGARLHSANAGLPRVGDKMPDGSIFAGISPDTSKPMYTRPEDVRLSWTFNEAQRFGREVSQYVNQDWRVPSKGELNVLFQNRAAIGGFDESGSYPAGWYWSSSQYSDYAAWDQRFSDGRQGYDGKDVASSLRCVR